MEEEDKKESEEEQENRPLETETVESEYDKNLRANRGTLIHTPNSSVLHVTTSPLNVYKLRKCIALKSY